MILAHPGQVVTHNDRPRVLGPTEYLVRCSCCESATIIVCDAGDVGADVLCEGCLCAAAVCQGLAKGENRVGCPL